MPLSKSFATAHIEKMVSRIYSFAVTASTTEVLVNAWSQRDLLQPVAWLFASMIALVNLGLLVSAFTTGSSKLWLRVHALAVIAVVTNWHFQVKGEWPQGAHPWIWWSLGTAAISAGIGYRRWARWLLQLAIPVSFLLVATSRFGGGFSIAEALQDAAYVFFLSASMSAIIWGLRDRARDTDSSNLKAISAETADYQSLALEREAISALSMVHTHVLKPLEEALEAKTPQDRKVAAASADYALRFLNYRLDFEDIKNPQLALRTLVESLEQTVRARYPKVAVRSSNEDEISLPSEVALALAEGTLQAVDNAARHAGDEAKIKLKIEGLSAGVKVVVSDDGQGFRVNRDTRGMVGINRSIRELGDTFGIESKIDTAPGKGCRVSFRWLAT